MAHEGNKYNYKHGMYKSSTYRSWQHMKTRCLSNPYYVGIWYTPGWHVFSNFFKDMGERPVGTTLDRRDNVGDYSRENCRWATVLEQNRNKRNPVGTSGERYISERKGRYRVVIRDKHHGWRDTLLEAIKLRDATIHATEDV